MGTGLAVVGAYILAGELAVAQGDYSAAFARYEQRIRGYAELCQRGARGVGGFMAPKTSAGIWFRNHMLRAAYLMPGRGMMEKIALKRASAVTLGEYPA
jgi:2-polyprenyl-6-methoxyphenol hydroxylase-like FAD-dependent oxidoreductase